MSLACVIFPPSIRSYVLKFYHKVHSPDSYNFCPIRRKLSKTRDRLQKCLEFRKPRMLVTLCELDRGQTVTLRGLPLVSVDRHELITSMLRIRSSRAASRMLLQHPSISLKQLGSSRALATIIDAGQKVCGRLSIVHEL